jgi:hypothetical protein
MQSQVYVDDVLHVGQSIYRVDGGADVDMEKCPLPGADHKDIWPSDQADQRSSALEVIVRSPLLAERGAEDHLAEVGTPVAGQGSFEDVGFDVAKRGLWLVGDAGAERLDDLVLEVHPGQRAQNLPAL